MKTHTASAVAVAHRTDDEAIHASQPFDPSFLFSFHCPPVLGVDFLPPIVPPGFPRFFPAELPILHGLD